MMQLPILSKEHWDRLRREPLQKYSDYKSLMEGANEDLAIASASLADPELVASATKAATMSACRLRGEIFLTSAYVGYSAGLSIPDLTATFPWGLDCWAEFAHHHLAFHQSPECDGHLVPHLDLYDRDYWEALQLVCFAILLGHSDLLGRIMDLLVYQNDDQDALLEALVAPYLPGRPGSTVYTRQLPYRKTRKIFEAAPDQRPALMARYLDEWYEASRREPYHDRHKASYFPGYWSLESAAITFVLDIDDSSYRDKRFYPRDLVDYARSVSVPPGKSEQPSQAEAVDGLRCEAGQACPRTGWWVTPAGKNSRRHFTQGETMPDLKSSWGATIWQWDTRQD